MAKRDISGSVNIDKWWGEVDSKILEALVFRSARMEPILVSEIAPWLPPSCRGNVTNTELVIMKFAHLHPLDVQKS